MIMEAAKKGTRKGWSFFKSLFIDVDGSVLHSSEAYKMLLIGESGSGRTSFLNLLVNCSNVQSMGERFDEVGLTAFNPVNDETLERHTQAEATSSDRMSSKTSGAKTYNVHLQRKAEKFTVGIIDTPGFGGTRGIEADEAHVKKIIDSLEDEQYINCVCLVMNGRLPRMSVNLQYVLSEITAILPKEMLHNVIFVFTNAESPLSLYFDPVLLEDYFQIPIGNYFCIENPYCLYERYVKSGKILTKKVVKDLKDSFTSTAETLGEMCKAMQAFKPVHTNRFVRVYEKKQEVEKKVIKLLGRYDHQTEIEKQLEAAEENASVAARLKSLNSGYQLMQTITKHVAIDTDRHNTLCNERGCYKNCHTPCTLDKAEDVKRCQSMRRRHLHCMPPSLQVPLSP